MSKKQTILSRLVLNGFATVIISFFIAGTILLGIAANSAQLATKEKYDMLNSNADRITEYSIEVFSDTWSPMTKNYKRTLATIAESIGANIIVFNSNSQIVAVGGLEEKDYIGRVLSGEYASQILGGKTITDISNIEIFDDKSMITVGKPIANGVTYGGVLVSAPSVNVVSTYSNVLRQFGIATIFALIIAFIMFYYIAKRITDPIKAMNNAVIEFSRGDFKKRVECSTNDELDTLAQNINQMAESIEDLEKLRSGFVSNVSHELRTPMTSITGFVEGILDGTIPEEKQGEYLKIVHTECKRLSRLVDDLLKISRLESGKTEVKKRIFNINELGRICILKFERDIEAKHIDVKLDFEKDNTDVYGDSDAVTQIITNIMHNAVKFTPDGGKICVRTYEKGDKICFEIKNSGDGIDDEKIKYIWDRFYKADDSRGANPDGVGLGLFIVKSLINKMKEQIYVSSVKGEYASFTFTISKP